jgi:hypothetical protein
LKRISLFLVIAISLLCWGQTSASEQTQSPTQPPPPVQEPAQQKAPDAKTPDAKAPTDSQVQPEHRISKAEEKELLDSVNAILKIQSEDTALPIKHDVKRQLISRDEVEKFFVERFRKDEAAQKLKRSEVVLKKFGLIPRDFYLEGFMLELLREQVAGYYNADNKTVYLLDWIDPDQQKPVLAHELTHALQDQNFKLEKWSKTGLAGEKKVQDEIQSDEQLAARDAVLEGQAMTAMLDYMLAPTGQSVLTSPLLVKATEIGMTTGGGSPVYDKAPLYLQQALIFPYTYGLDFTVTLLKKGGKEKAYADVFRNPPQNTREIMEPETYLAREKLPPLTIPDFKNVLGHDWDRYDVGSIGEFDVSIMAQQYGMKRDESEKLATGWRGGYYYAALKHGTKDPKTADTSVVFVTKWANSEQADQFAKAYLGYLPKRYTAVTSSHDPAQAFQKYGTNEGTVIANQKDGLLTITESFEDATAQKLMQAVEGTQAKP